ncbi:TolC family protein [Segatella copri]|jgi:outer membrane protein|uniref:TolC family protein n=1 Tax=Segatella copri TaxID=165179 RepID=A0AA92VBT5_9BACT|nr:TolC family protein [Segatella copri]RHL38409.1 TolC family protein [Segatella copri]
MKKKVLMLGLLSLALIDAHAAGNSWSLDSLRARAVSNNKSLLMAGQKKVAASYTRKSAATNYLPKVSATGAYMYTSRELSLLSDEQKHTLSNIGTGLSAMVPNLAPMSSTINSVGQGVVDALHTDTRNAGIVAVTLTQPIYMGGKIRVYNKITQYAEEAAGTLYDKELQDIIVDVDEAYWNLVALYSKKKLAEGYKALVDKLEGDVEKLVKEGMATKADLLSVKVKVNEAGVTLIQVNNGIELSRMNLCRICGLDMNEPVEVEDAIDEKNQNANIMGQVDMFSSKSDNLVQQAESNRKELQALGLQNRIYDEKIKLARAEYLPKVALMGGYLASNPSVFNSFERKMKGMWNVGITLNVPILTWGDRSYKVKSAKAEALMHRYETEEVKEKIELQVNQCRQKLQESMERYQTTLRSVDEAEENLRYANLGMKEGVITLSNVMEAQTAWLKAKSEWVNAQVDVRLANLYLRKAVGSIDTHI